jgi:hypothetical protein
MADLRCGSGVVNSEYISAEFPIAWHDSGPIEVPSLGQSCKLLEEIGHRRLDQGK